MARKSFVKFECLVLAISICFGMLALTGCDQSKETELSEETGRITGEDIKGGDPDPTPSPSPTPSPTPSPSPTPMPDSEAEPEALKIAEEVGLSKEDLRGKYALFLRYSYAIECNPNVIDFRSFLYRFFPLVADHLKSEKEEVFFQKITTLKYVIEKTDEYAGAYSPSENIIYMQSTLKGYIGEDYYNLVVYHETMHFMDYVIDGPIEEVFHRADGTFGIPTYDDFESEDRDKGIRAYDAAYFVEGGAEKYKTEYFTKASTDPNPTGLEFLVGLEYILGKEKADEFFFDYDTAYSFSVFLSENGFSNDEIYRLLNTMETDKVMKDGSKYIDPREVLIRLYALKKGPNYDKDPKFCKIIASMDKSIINKIPTDYRSFISKQKKITSKQRKNLISQVKKKLKTKKEVYLNQDPYTFFIDGELKLVTMAYTYKGDIPDYVSVIIDYDFEKDSIKGISLFEAWAPKKLPGTTKLPTEEADALVKTLYKDNSEAHNQTVVGTADLGRDKYEKAEELGNKYGIEIWFADLTPKGVLFNEDTRAEESAAINRTLNSIERVLSLYPEDYFDQLLFNYYSGVAICLYSGWFEEAFPESIYVNGKNYLIFYVDTEIDHVQGYPGGDAILKMFLGSNPMEAELICDIWRATEKVISLRNKHYEKPALTDSTWTAKNYKGFKYLNSKDSGKLTTYAKKTKMQYFLCNESLINSKSDRVLCYEYMMLYTLTEGKLIADKPTPECLEKLRELKRAIRQEFDTTNWPGWTSWERAMIKL